MENLGNNIWSAIRKLSGRLKEIFKQPEVKEEITELIEKKSRASVLEKLEEKQRMIKEKIYFYQKKIYG